MENINSIEILSTRLYELIKSEAYTESTIIAMKSALNRLSSFMERNNLTEYTPEVGESFVAHRVSEHVCSALVSRTKSITGKLNRLIQGKDGTDALLSDNSKKFELPDDLMKSLRDYSRLK